MRALRWLLCLAGRHDPWCRGRLDHICDHNVIPFRSWLGARWACVRCDLTFREVPSR